MRFLSAILGNGFLQGVFSGGPKESLWHFGMGLYKEIVNRHGVSCQIYSLDYDTCVYSVLFLDA